jgi:hypothetical protein
MPGLWTNFRCISQQSHIKNEPICIDYATIYFSPYWLNSIRREGVFIHGRPLKPLSDKHVEITKDNIDKMIKWLKFYNLTIIKDKLDINYLETRKIRIPKFLNTLQLAASYYESYPIKETLLDKFLTLIFSLETLLSQTTETTYRISTYASTMLANYGPERAKIYNFIKKVIRSRNDLVHGNKSFNDLGIDDDNIFELASYIRKLIISFISLYLREEKYDDKRLRDKFIQELDKLAVGAEDYELFEKIKDLEILVDETLADPNL